MGINSDAKRTLLNHRRLRDATLYTVPKNANQVYFDMSQLWHRAPTRGIVKDVIDFYCRTAEFAFRDGGEDVIFFADNRANVPLLKIAEQKRRESTVLQTLKRRYDAAAEPMPDHSTLDNVVLPTDINAALPQHWELALNTHNAVRIAMFKAVADWMFRYTRIPPRAALIVYGIAELSDVPLVKLGDDPTRVHELPRFKDDIGENELRVVRWVALAREHWRVVNERAPHTMQADEVRHGLVIMHSSDGDFLPILLDRKSVV